MKNTTELEITIDIALEKGFSIDVFNTVKKVLGRNPQQTELDLFQALNENGKLSLKSLSASTNEEKNTVVNCISDVEESFELKEEAYKLLQHPAVVSHRFLYENCKGELAQKVANHAELTIQNVHAFACGLSQGMASGNAFVDGYLATVEASRNLVSMGANPTYVIVGGGNQILLDGLHTNATDFVKGFAAAAADLSLTIAKNDAVNGSVASLTSIALAGPKLDVAVLPTMNIKHKGDLIFLFGDSCDNADGSIYANFVHGLKNIGTPAIDVAKEKAVQLTILSLIENNLITAAHSVSKGGVFTALIEMGMADNYGFDVEADGEVRLDTFLFGESQGRIIVTVKEDDEDRFIEYLATIDVPSTLLGHVTKGKIVIDGEHYGFIDEAKDQYNKALLKRLQ